MACTEGQGPRCQNGGQLQSEAALPFLWSGGDPADIGVRHQEEQPLQSCSRSQPQGNSSGC